MHSLLIFFSLFKTRELDRNPALYLIQYPMKNLSKYRCREYINTMIMVS